MSKTYTLMFADGSGQEYGSKKTATKYGEESGKDYKILSPTGQVVADVKVPTPDPAPDQGQATRTGASAREIPASSYQFTLVSDLPGNYAIVMAPFVEGLAAAYGQLETRVETFPGKLLRRVHVSGEEERVRDFMVAVANPAIELAQSALHVWQRENIEKRRGLTDMERYLQHREFLTKQGEKFARKVKKTGSL